MSELQKIIDQVTAAYESEMRSVETRRIWADIFGGKPADPHENYLRQTRQGPDYDEERAALRKALIVTLGTEEEQKRMLLPAAEKAVKTALHGVTEKRTFWCEMEF